jgi:alpha-mannosidase
MMGMEVYQGTFKEIARAGDFPAQVEAREEDGVLVVRVTSEFAGHTFTRKLFFRSDSPAVRMRLTGRARDSRSVTVCFRPELRPGRFVQAVTYGVVERPLEKLFSPTFWAVKDWVDLVDKSEKFGAHLAVSAPGAVAARSDGSLEAVALRNARAERARGIPAIQTLVANGTDPGVHEFEYAFWPHGPESWLARRAWDQARRALAQSFIAPEKPDLESLAASLINLDRSDVEVAAIKKPESGQGIIVRLYCYAPEQVTVRLTFAGQPVQEALRVDALERKLAPLSVAGGQVEVEMPYALVTVLLKF